MEKLNGGFERRRKGWPLPVYLIGIALLFSVYQLYLRTATDHPSLRVLDAQTVKLLDEGLQRCAEDNYIPDYTPTRPGRSNPRFNTRSGQKDAVWIRNATVFDGERVLVGPRDIYFTQGIITSMIATSDNPQDAQIPDDLLQIDAQGKWVTPGLVDMHSHHLIMMPGLYNAQDDGNEVSVEEFGPVTPFLRSLDGLKSYDEVATLIAAGGVTSSLILPGSANIMGGEAFPVKNILRSGPDGEEVVEELLLQHGLPKHQRQRYMKMACGENPKNVYGHTRMGNAWKLREQMAKGQALRAKQDLWCLTATAAKESGDIRAMREVVKPPPSGKPGYPEELKLDSTVAMLRGKVNVNIHCYEPEDIEDMFRHSAEFGFPINALHHATAAWRVPEMIKNSGHNVTLAIFQDFALYKIEAYLASLHSGKILTDHGLPVAYKSDHTGEDTYARYLLSQAAGAHAFGLSEELALKSVTSVPARSMNQGHRIGYIQPSYDADLVIWDSHPLSIGATPVEVYIDGKATIQNAVYTVDANKLRDQPSIAPQSKKELTIKEQQATCAPIQNAKRLVFSGISKSFTEITGIKTTAQGQKKMTLILDSGKVVCFGTEEDCIHNAETDTIITLNDGHVLPGLIAVTGDLGLNEISGEPDTQDGTVKAGQDISNPSDVVYAKYGVHLDGKGFDRAKIGGVTRAITPPLSSHSFMKGVSTGFRTTGNESILDGGIFADDVALHVSVGVKAKSDSIPTVSDQIGKIHRLVTEHKGKDSIFGKVADGKLPLVVHVFNSYNIAQLIKLKREHKDLKLIILGGHGAPAVAQELADADIPVIFTAYRGIADLWERKGVLPGPPLSKSPARLLVEAGVKFAIAQITDDNPNGASGIHNLLLEASWAAKFAGLSDQQAVELVSKNVEDIFGLEKSEEIVVYEGNPLEYGASVVLTVNMKQGAVTECWPTVV